MTTREVRDAVHGLVRLSPTEWQIVDSPAFQRLRNVQQLAATHLVYPGARHSRFEHCMGACHVAGRIAEHLDLPAEDQERIRLAALCHDLGHGPFSHVSEFVFEELTGDSKIHEKISAAIVRHHTPIRDALGDERAEWIADLLATTGHGSHRSVARDIIAGPADIDKLDYLLRDSLYCGVEYGRYDLDKIIESAKVTTSVEGDDYLTYHQDGVFAVEGMLLARYHMLRQVYGHKTRLATDRMLMRAMRLGVEEDVLPRQVFAPTDFDADFVTAYLDWDDHSTIHALLADTTKPSGQLMLALTQRRLLKRICLIEGDTLEQAGASRFVAGFAMQPSDSILEAQRAEAEATVAEAAGVDPLWVSLVWNTIENPLTSRKDFRIADNEVLFSDGDMKLIPFGELSEIFSSSPGQNTRRSVSVYVKPPDGVTFDQDAKAKIREAAVGALRAVGQAGQAV